MGFNISDVLSDESHYSEFVCVVCRDLVDDAHVLPCSHVFCRHCLQQWLVRAAKTSGEANCPSCRTQPIGCAQPLAEANPLAARILGRVRCRCPLWAQKCDWTGDYSEVQAHLTNSDEHKVQEQPRRETAEALKAQADCKYVARAYAQAAALYSKAIDVAPEVASFWANRGACAFMERRYEACVADCDKALSLDAAMTKAARRKAKAKMELSEFDCAQAELAAALASAVTDKERQAVRDEQGTLTAVVTETTGGVEALCKGDFKAASGSFGRALKTTTAVVVVLGAAVAELGLGHVDRALRLTRQVLTRKDGHAYQSSACAVCGAALVLQDAEDVDNGLALLREALRLDPDCDDAKNALRSAKRLKRSRDDAKSLMTERSFEDAVAAYGSVLDELGAGSRRVAEPPRGHCTVLPPLSMLAAATPVTAHVRAERANCYLRLGDHATSLRDCAHALYIKDDCMEAHLTRAAALRAAGRHDQALRDLEDLLNKWGTHDVRIRHAYEYTDFENRKLKRPDYYAVLACRRVATDKEIKTAYYKKSKEHHPDRHVSADTQTRREHEHTFKLVSEALEILDDPTKRKLYDEGYDKAAIEDRVAAAERAARNHSHYGAHHH